MEMAESSTVVKSEDVDSNSKTVTVSSTLVSTPRSHHRTVVLWSVLHEVTIALFALEQLPSLLMTLLGAPKVNK